MFEQVNEKSFLKFINERVQVFLITIKSEEK